jgi:hypothetical protein
MFPSLHVLDGYDVLLFPDALLVLYEAEEKGNPGR